MQRIEAIERQQMRDDLPEFGPGDTVKVHYKVVEGNRERIQTFQGTVIALKNSGSRRTFVVRKVSFGVGVEKTFPLHSPKIAGIDIVSRGHVRRSKLYYLRKKVGKKARVREKRY